MKAHKLEGNIFFFPPGNKYQLARVLFELTDKLIYKSNELEREREREREDIINRAIFIKYKIVHFNLFNHKLYLAPKLDCTF